MFTREYHCLCIRNNILDTIRWHYNKHTFKLLRFFSEYKTIRLAAKIYDPSVTGLGGCLRSQNSLPLYN